MKTKTIVLIFSVIFVIAVAMLTPKAAYTSNLAYCADGGVCLGVTQLDVYGDYAVYGNARANCHYMNSISPSECKYNYTRITVYCTGECDTIPDAQDIVNTTGTICFVSGGYCRTAHNVNTYQNCCGAGTAVEPTPTPVPGGESLYIGYHNSYSGVQLLAQCRAVGTLSRAGSINLRVYIDGDGNYAPSIKNAALSVSTATPWNIDLKNYINDGLTHKIEVYLYYDYAGTRWLYPARNTGKYLTCADTLAPTTVPPTATPIATATPLATSTPVPPTISEITNSITKFYWASMDVDPGLTLPSVDFTVTNYAPTYTVNVDVFTPVGQEYFNYSIPSSAASISGTTATFHLNDALANVLDGNHSVCTVSGDGCFGTVLGNPLWGDLNGKPSDAIGVWHAYVTVTYGGTTTPATEITWEVISTIPVEP